MNQQKNNYSCDPDLFEVLLNIPKDGMLIVCEGLSGAGKSTLTQRLLQYYEQQGVRTILVRWNSVKCIVVITNIFRRYSLLTPKIYSFLQWLSFLWDYLFTVSPRLKRQGCVVIADRYFYTGLTRDINNGVSMRYINSLCKLVRKPDVLLFLNVPPSECLKRIKKRKKKLFVPGCNSSNDFNINWEHRYMLGIYNSYEWLFSNEQFAAKSTYYLANIDTVMRHI